MVLEVLSLRAEQPWWLTTTPEAPLFPPFSQPDTLQTAKPVTVRHQGSLVCQHLPADKDRAGKILGPGEHIAASTPSVRDTKCVWGDTERVLMCLFSVTAAKQKTLMRGGRRHEYIRAPRRRRRRPSTRPSIDEKWRWKALTNRTGSRLPWARARLPLALRPVGSSAVFRKQRGAITSSAGLDVLETRKIWDSVPRRPSRTPRLINNEGIGQKKNKPRRFETAGPRGRGVETNDPPTRADVPALSAPSLGNLFANWATDDGEFVWSLSN